MTTKNRAKQGVKYVRVVISHDDTDKAIRWCDEIFCGSWENNSSNRWFYSWGGFYLSSKKDLSIFLLRWGGVVSFNNLDDDGNEVWQVEYDK